MKRKLTFFAELEQRHFPIEVRTAVVREALAQSEEVLIREGRHQGRYNLTEGSPMRPSLGADGRVRIADYHSAEGFAPELFDLKPRPDIDSVLVKAINNDHGLKNLLWL